MSSPKSQKMKDKPKFLNRYNNCNDNIKSLIDEITKRLIDKSCFANWGYTNSPDLRFSCAEMGFCKFELNPPDRIKMFIRVDDLAYNPTLEKASLAARFSICKRSGFKGKKWIETELNENSQIEPILSIINELCEDRAVNGW